MVSSDKDQWEKTHGAREESGHQERGAALIPRRTAGDNSRNAHQGRHQQQRHTDIPGDNPPVHNNLFFRGQSYAAQLHLSIQKFLSLH
jgi:hypothetical protein